MALCRHKERFLLRLWRVSHPLHYTVIDTQKKAFSGLRIGILLTWLTEPTAEAVFGVVRKFSILNKPHVMLMLFILGPPWE